MTLEHLPLSKPRSHPPSPPARVTAIARPSAATGWWESGLQIGFNALVAIAAIGSLAQLLPEREDRHTELSRLEANVTEREAQVDRLRDRFAYYFDPAQFETVIREESQKIHPQQRPIVWLDAP